MRHILVFVSLLSVSACAAPGWFRTHAVGIQQGQLHPCPEAPRCLSSDMVKTSERYHQGFGVAKTMSNTEWQAIVESVAQMERTAVVTTSSHYLHAVISSPWGWYEDDLELHWRPQEAHIAIRSSGRIGWYDFKVNQKRVIKLRERLLARWLIKP